MIGNSSIPARLVAIVLRETRISTGRRVPENQLKNDSNASDDDESDEAVARR